MKPIKHIIMEQRFNNLGHAVGGAPAIALGRPQVTAAKPKARSDGSAAAVVSGKASLI
jgi:hypothetical protein